MFCLWWGYIISDYRSQAFCRSLGKGKGFLLCQITWCRSTLSGSRVRKSSCKNSELLCAITFSWTGTSGVISVLLQICEKLTFKLWLLASTYMCEPRIIISNLCINFGLLVSLVFGGIFSTFAFYQQQLIMFNMIEFT